MYRHYVKYSQALEREKNMSEGLFLLRVVFGLMMAAHGAQKLLGWFGGYGLTGTGGYFEGLGFRPGRLFAAAAGGTEILSGLLMTLGFLGPVGPALMVSVMIVAAISVHWKNGLFAQNGGIEMALLYAVAGATLAFTGPGRLSVDALLGFTALSSPLIAVLALIIGVIGAVANLLARRPVPAVAELKQAA
jgi:putative oxidoreductase